MPKPPDRGEASDRDRLARAPERAERPTNPLPFARGNTPERVDEPPKQMARGRGPDPEPAAGQPSQNTQPSNAQKLPESQSALQLPPQQTDPQNGGPQPKVGVGASEDSFVVYDGTAAGDPMSNAAIWRCVAKNGLKPPDVPAVEEFKKIFDETEKQQQQQQKKP